MWTGIRLQLKRSVYVVLIASVLIKLPLHKAFKIVIALHYVRPFAFYMVV